MTLLYSEQMDLFQRLKDKDTDKLLQLSVTYKAHKNYEKVRIADLLIKIKSQGIKGLNALHKELSRSGALMEADYVNSLLKEKEKIKAEEEKKATAQKRKAGLEKRQEAKKDKISVPGSSPGLSEEVCKEMVTRIKLNSQRHRERTRGLLPDEDE
jgi:hypothetical protein